MLLYHNVVLTSLFKNHRYFMFGKIFKDPKRHEPFNTSHDLFPPVDIEKASNNLKLKKHGEENGKSNFPNKSANNFDEVERSIIDLMNTLKGRAFATANSQYTAYMDRIKNLKAHSKIHEIETAKINAIADINSKCTIAEDNNLFLLRKEIINIEDELIKFKKNNKIDELPSYAESRTFSFSLVAFFLILESCLNAYFFSKGDELGYLGGTIKAFMISLINIGFIGILFGWLISRYIVHIKIFKKIFGIFGIITTSLSLIGFNTLIAHYRLYYSQNLENPGALALQSFLSHPFSLTNIESLFLIIIGVSFSLITIIKFWVTFEIYPGYESRDRKLNAKKSLYAEIKEELIELITEGRDTGMNLIQKNLDQINAIQRENPSLVAKINNLQVQYENYLKALEDNGRTLLTIYRENNKKHRQEPTPKYWDDVWCLEKTENIFHLPDTISYSDILSETVTKANDFVKEIDRCYHVAIDKIKSLQDLHIEAYAKN